MISNENKELTVAIPTYNRPVQLRKAMNEILRQLRSLPDPGKVELLVVDNASTTHDISDLLALECQSGEVKVFRNSTNLGIDGNVKRCVQESNGAFVWLVSDDDLITEGSIEQILRATASSQLGLFLANYSIFDEDLEITIKGPVIKIDEKYRPGSLAHLTYISSTILNNKRLKENNNLGYFDHYLGSLYYHMALAISLANDHDFELLEGIQIKFRSGCSDLGGTVKAALDPFRIFKAEFQKEKNPDSLAADFFFWENVWPLVKHLKRTHRLNKQIISDISEDYRSWKYSMLMGAANLTPLGIIKTLQKLFKN